MVRVEEVRINATFKEENVKFRIFIPLMAPDKLLTSGKIYKLSSTVLLPNLLQDVFVHSYKSNYIQLQRLEVNHIHKVGGWYSSKMYSISHTRLDSVTFCKISMRRKMFINSLQMEPREKLAFPNSEGIFQKKSEKGLYMVSRFTMVETSVVDSPTHLRKIVPWNGHSILYRHGVIAFSVNNIKTPDPPDKMSKERDYPPLVQILCLHQVTG